MQTYLNERVSELNPEFLEKTDNEEILRQLSEQILKEMSRQLNMENMTWEEILQYFNEEQIKSVIEYVINQFDDDWLNQFIKTFQYYFQTHKLMIAFGFIFVYDLQ